MVNKRNSSSAVIKIHLRPKSAHAANAQQQLLRPPLTHILITENKVSRGKVINAVCTKYSVSHQFQFHSNHMEYLICFSFCEHISFLLSVEPLEC